MKRLPLLLGVFFITLQLHAQENQPSPIIFIYDASGSMWGQIDGISKMEIATDVLSTSVNNLPENQNVGLVAYGHRHEGDCRDVEFLIDMGNSDKTLVNQSLMNIKPLGRTPLAYSATQVIDRLRQSQKKATIILVTDGIESCDGNICEVVKSAKDEGIDFRLHIIGFGLQGEETAQLQCAATAGDGQYYDAENAEALSEVLNEVTEATVDKPTGNFSVYAIKNGEPIDAMVEAYQAGTATEVQSGRTYRDTTSLYLPSGLYDLKVTPLENSDVSSITVYGIQSFDDQMGHQTVSFDGGTIRVMTTNNGEGWDATVRIYSRDGTRVAQGRTYGRADEYELDPGTYDVEVTALVIEGVSVTHRFENLEVKPNEVIETQHNFKSGIAMIGAKSSEGLVDAVINIYEIDSNTSVASGRSYTTSSSNPKKFTLTPGTYRVVLNALGEHSGKSETATIEVKEGETVENIVTF